MLEDLILEDYLKDSAKKFLSLIADRKSERKELTEDDVKSIFKNEHIIIAHSKLLNLRVRGEELLDNFIHSVFIDHIKEKDKNLELDYWHISESRCHDCKDVVKIKTQQSSFLYDFKLNDMIRNNKYKFECKNDKKHSDLELIATRNVIKINSKKCNILEVSTRVKAISLSDKYCYYILLGEDITDYYGARVVVKDQGECLKVVDYLKTILEKNINSLNDKYRLKINLKNEKKEFNGNIHYVNFPRIGFQTKPIFSTIKINYAYHGAVKEYEKFVPERHILNIQIRDLLSDQQCEENIVELSHRKYAERVTREKYDRLKKKKLVQPYHLLKKIIAPIFNPYEF